MSVETKPNKLTKGLVLDTFHTDVDNTVATYALNSQLEDQEGNHFHYGSEVGTTFIKNIPDTHVVIGHINMERNETVLFTTDGTNSTIGILSRNDDMSYNYEIKVDDSKQTKKLGFKKNTYIRGVYRLLNGCDKVIYFVDGINKDRRINLNQLDSYKLPTTTTSEITFDNNVSAIIYNISTLTGDIKLIKILAPTNILTQSNLIANLIRVINFQSNLSTSSSLIGDINFVQKVASSLNAFGTLTGDINFVQNMQSALNGTAALSGGINFVQKPEASLNAFGSLVSDLKIGKTFESSLNANGTLVSDATITKNLASSLTSSNSLAANALVSKLASASLTGAGTTAANLTVQSAAPLLLDLYPSAAAAYSLRKLRSAYTGSAIRVRRSSDNTEQDIGFTGNDLDTTALTTFVGSGNGFVTTWYDQSGNARNVTQTTQASQPQIVSSGVVISTNSKPSVRFNGTSNVLNGGDILSVDSNPLFISQVAKQATTGNMAWYSKAFANTQAGAHTVYNENNIINARVTLNTGNNRLLNLGASLTTPLLISSEFIPNTSFKGYVNNIEKASNTTVSIVGTCNLNFRLGGYGDATNTNTILFFNGEIQEFIFYLSNQTTNRSNINSNINTHYGIY